MTPNTNELFQAAQRLHHYILREHWHGQALLGPDPGIRFNARIGRFIKSYLSFLSWPDDLAYMQAQGYWILDNWLMADLLENAQLDNGPCRNLAIACSEFVLSAQCSDGYWDYPNPEWKGRIATVEGCFAVLGLLESYARLEYEPFLIGAKKWYQYLMDGIGFRKQAEAGMLAVQYFAHQTENGGGVPNNSTLVLWTLARLAEVTGDDRFLAMTPSMVTWLKHVQLRNGELPYAVGASPHEDRRHFLCFQYNAFEFIDLAHYYCITGDRAIWPVMQRLADYLTNGITEAGAARYDCMHDTPEVTYYTSAVAQALSQATCLGIGDFRLLSHRAFRRVLSQQRSDGGAEFHSRANYRILYDRRSYPRYLTMMLNHLLREYQIRTVDTPTRARAK